MERLIGAYVVAGPNKLQMELKGLIVLLVATGRQYFFANGTIESFTVV